MLALPSHAELVTAVTEQEVVSEEMTVEASIARLQAEGLAARQARAIAERMTADDHAYFQEDGRRMQPGAGLQAILALAVRVAFLS
jgi:hypothetical protein